MSSRAAAVKLALSREVVSMYRDICRKVPSLLAMYKIEGYSPSEARHMVLLNQFRSKASVTDPRMIERLLVKAKQEMEEVNQTWKQKAHIRHMLAPLAEESTKDVMLDRDEFMNL